MVECPIWRETLQSHQRCRTARLLKQLKLESTLAKVESTVVFSGSS